MKVETSQWATPIVPVPKKNGEFRICADYKTTVNPMLNVDQHPFPKPIELFAALTGGQKFSTLDLVQAYQQLPLDKDTQELLTISTHLGLYRNTRLPFWGASAPALFQRTMDILLQGLPKVMCYLDDIIVTGHTDEEHFSYLEEVLRRLSVHGFRLKQPKCSLFQSSVEFLGHTIDAQDVHTLLAKCQAIVKAQAPRDVTELRSFLGLLNYYGRFIPNLASLLHLLNQLLRKGVVWKWSEECAQAFKVAKEALVLAHVLAHYYPALPLLLAADALSYGVGAVISQYLDGRERLITFASRTLTAAEKNYAQLEKEALALVFGVKHFHQYLYGRLFTIVTDHQPLTYQLGPQKPIPSLAAARLQWWAITLSARQYRIKFRKTSEHANADGLSRLPLQTAPGPEVSIEAACFNIGQIEALPISATKLGTASRQDPVISQAMLFTQNGWPLEVSPELKPFYRRRSGLMVEGNCLLWGTRVVVPRKLQNRVLQELHCDHTGMGRTKSIARSYIRWPGMDPTIEELVGACEVCQSVKSAPPVAPLHPWVWPKKPWQRVHADFAGPSVVGCSCS